jgi:hypothetical protein
MNKTSNSGQTSYETVTLIHIGIFSLIEKILLFTTLQYDQ